MHSGTMALKGLLSTRVLTRVLDFCLENPKTAACATLCLQFFRPLFPGESCRTPPTPPPTAAGLPAPAAAGEAVLWGGLVGATGWMVPFKYDEIMSHVFESAAVNECRQNARRVGIGRRVCPPRRLLAHLTIFTPIGISSSSFVVLLLLRCKKAERKTSCSRAQLPNCWLGAALTAMTPLPRMQCTANNNGSRE